VYYNIKLSRYATSDNCILMAPIRFEVHCKVQFIALIFLITTMYLNTDNFGLVLLHFFLRYKLSKGKRKKIENLTRMRAPVINCGRVSQKCDKFRAETVFEIHRTALFSNRRFEGFIAVICESNANYKYFLMIYSKVCFPCIDYFLSLIICNKLFLSEINSFTLVCIYLYNNSLVYFNK